ncbi:MAG: AsmA family protein [Hyphomicrobiaceae bacterium]|nr:MAG: AsmA family protein [Hyphomicrobiaceae bacterium]
MRRKKLISRLTTLALATIGCLLLALLAPIFLAYRAPVEPFSGNSVMASPRDLHVITAPIRLSGAPDVTLIRGVLYADGNAAAGTPISRFVLDGPVFSFNASGARATSPGFEASMGEAPAIAPLVEQLMTMGFDTLAIRRGTLNVTALDGTVETISDIEAEVTGRRKDQITARGSFTVRGQSLKIEAALSSPTDKRAPLRWPAKFTLKGSLLDASFDGHFDLAEDIQLSGQAEISTPSLRRAARWFGVLLTNAPGLNATTIKGQIRWARRTFAVENAKVIVDGNEAAGTLSLNLAGERPLIDGTLAFNALDLTPYAQAARSQSFVFDRETASWSAFDISMPIIRHVDADLRISAPKVAMSGFGLGRGAATISVRSGKLLADIAELDLHAGTVSAQISADMNDFVPRYAMRGRVEKFEAGRAAAAMFGTTALSGRSTLAVDVAGSGQTPTEILRHLSGKATLTMPEGGRIGLDLKGLRGAAKTGEGAAWTMMSKGQTNLEQVEARAHIQDGVLITEAVQARVGSAGVGASGRVDLVEGTLNLDLLMKPEVPADRPLKAVDLLGGDAVRVTGTWRQPLVQGVERNTGLAPK